MLKKIYKIIKRCDKVVQIKEDARKEFWPGRLPKTDRVVFFFPARWKTVGLDPETGPRQFNKLGGVWIFLISRRSWTGGRAWSSCRNVDGRRRKGRAYFKSSNARLESLGYSCHAPRSALNASDPEGRVSIGVEAPLREPLAVFAIAVPLNALSNDLIVCVAASRSKSHCNREIIIIDGKY